MDDRIRAKEIFRMIYFYLRGSICRAEMWNQIENRLADRNPSEILNQLSDEYQGVLKGLCFEYPNYLLATERTNPIRQAIWEWCSIG